MKTNTKNIVKDDDFTIITEDINKIQTRPTVYIGSLGEVGVFHLCKEIIDNATDEVLKPYSPCTGFHIEATDKMIRVVDNGRGIPTNLLQKVYETIQAGSNLGIDTSEGKGRNGIGSTCVLALSSYLRLITTRPTEKKRLTLEYKDGALVNKVLEEYTGKSSGFDVTFKPSKKCMGTNLIPCDRIVEWMKELDYTMKPGVNITYTINGEEHAVEYHSLHTFIDQYVPTDARGEDIRQSWMNMINTVQHGDHMTGVLRGFYKAITERIYKKNKKLDGENLKKDVVTHLNIAVKATSTFGNMFSAQAKDRVMEEHLLKAVTEAVYNELSNSNNSVLNEICDAIIGNYRARIEGDKARDISKSVKAIKSYQKPDTYYPCSNVKTVEPKELFLVEGNSAGGGLKGARDAKYQAILTFKGKSLNIWDLSLDRALQSIPWLNLVKVLGCGIGPTFDIKKLNFDKIIIATDADIDGYHIRVGMCAFFVKFLPEIVRAGKLYIAEPPLYKLMKGKDVFYVASQTEYLQQCVDSIGNIEIEFPEMIA